MVIDLRGSPTGLEGLGEALAQLFKDPNDKVRAYFLENEEEGAAIAEAHREQSRRLQRGEGISPAQVQALGDANIPTETLTLPALPGGGLVPPEILAELLERHPETPEMKRTREVGEARRGQVTAEEEAQVITQPTRRALAGEKALPITEEAEIGATERRARVVPALRLLAENEAVSPREWGDAFRISLGADQAEAELRDYEASWGLDYQKALETSGMTPDVMSKRAYDNFLLEGKRLEAQGLEVAITQRDLERHLEVYNSLSPAHKRLFSLGNMPGSQYVAQALLQGLAYDHQASTARIADAKTVEELIMARAADRITLQGAMDDEIVLLNAAVDDKEQGRIEELANRLTAHARDLMAIDPQAGFAQAELLRNLFGNIAGVEFSMGDILSTGQMSGWYSTLATEFNQAATQGFLFGAENTAAAAASLDNALKDKLTGAVNPREKEFVLLLANEMRSGAAQEQEAMDAQQAAQEATVGTFDPVEMEAEIQRALTEFNNAVSGLDPEQQRTVGDLPPNVYQLFRRVRILEMRKFFLAGGPKRLEVEGSGRGVGGR